TISPVEAGEVSRIISDSLNNARLPAEVAFYGGSFTAIEKDLMVRYLDAVSPFISDGIVSGIRLSTRPDCINEEVLQILEKYNVHTIELGAQSMDDAVLLKSGRGHTSADTENAAKLIKSSGFSLILQMMTHLPGSNDALDIETAKRIAALSPSGVRVYPTVVIRNTGLETLWLEGKYTPATPEEAAELGADILKIFEAADIPVIRFGLNPTDELSGGEALSGAYHPALGEMARSQLLLRRAKCEIENRALRGGEIIISVNPSSISAMSGLKKENKKKLSALFGFSKISVCGDSSLGTYEVRILKP
ncbi:MAG: radical SAM protein, partial [Oscillospiraceae bacterium]|nr:radical SAM protein [Oscillospiraceae bacterium]